MPRPITLVDFGAGNLHTIQRKLERLGARTTVTSEPEPLRLASKLVLPGVGHFARTMHALAERGMVEALGEAALIRGIPVLGICLGMHLMASRGEEGDAAGLGWIDGDVVRFSMPDPVRHKVPQMGWNTARPRKASPLFQGVPLTAEFYFAHGYHLVARDPADVLCETEYGYLFTSAVARDNLFGVQFHPEKSHDAGERLLQNFVGL